MQIPNYPVIRIFRGEFAWLSNFCKCQIEHNGITFESVEHAYQILKFQDAVHKHLANTMDPLQAKRYAKEQGANYPDRDMAVATMEYLLLQKFNKSQNPSLAKRLKDTGNAFLIEGNVWNDSFWGYDITKGVGRNMLGALIMRVRSIL